MKDRFLLEFLKMSQKYVAMFSELVILSMSKNWG